MNKVMLRRWARCVVMTVWAGLAACGGGGADTSVRADSQLVQVSSTTADSSSPIASVVVRASNMPSTGLFAGIEFSGGGIGSADWFALSDTDVRLDITFVAGSLLAAGTHEGQLRFQVCHDAACARQVGGSPIVIQTRYTVIAATSGPGTGTPVVPVDPEAGLTPINVLSRQTLAHDVIDAEYSKTLDAIVMVSSWPVNALYILDPATGIERQQLLVKVPTAVSIAPDGTHAAVGHDALITHVDLNAVGTVQVATRLLNVSTGVFDLVLDGRGRVHAFPVSDQWVDLHTVDVLTNTETLVQGLIRAGTRARLHPSGDAIYTADNGLSPSDIARIDVSTDPPTYAYDSPYHGDYAMCGDVWPSQDGATLYTRCGNVFRSSVVRAQDMRYAGSFQLSGGGMNSPFVIQSLSHSQLKQQVALIEHDPFACTSNVGAGNCHYHLNVYESSFLNRQSIESIPPMTVAGSDYPQRGLFVFHRADGNRKFLITRLDGMPNPQAEYHLSILP